MTEQTHTFHISGMHCAACELLTESEICELPQVRSAKASLAANTLTVSGDFGAKPATEIAGELNRVLTKHGYELSLDKNQNDARWSEFKIALPIAIAFIALFLLLQKLGIVNLITSDNVGYGTAFFIGIVASLSTCMAMVGGLVLSMSATFSRAGDRLKPQLLFHGGRLVAFFLLGGAIGALGASFSLGVTGVFVLSLLIGLVMLILGLNLLNVFPWAQRLQPSLPKLFAKRFLGATRFNHSFTPALVGIITFFLPCGFTQSMQIYSLSTGSFLGGALTMFAFALGTLPVLALVSFSSFSIGKGEKAGIFFKSAGLIVMLLGLYNILNALAAVGILPPLLNI